MSFLQLHEVGATLCFGAVASLVAHRLERTGSVVVMHSLVALQHVGASYVGNQTHVCSVGG